jgi:CHASE3 domain sensor protein
MALLVLSLFGAVALFSVSRLSTQRAEIADANSAIAMVDQILTASSDAERAGTDFMMNGSRDALEAFQQARGRVEEAVDSLNHRSEDRPAQRTALVALGPLLSRRFDALNAGIVTRQRKGAEAAAAFAQEDAGRATRGGILPLVERMRGDELRVLAERTRLEAAHGRTAMSVILAGSIIAFLLSLLAFTPIKPSVAGRLTRRLTTPLGMASISEFSESYSDATRVAGDRLSRLEQLAFLLDTPGTAEAVGDAIVLRGISGIAVAASLVCRYDGDVWHTVARRSTKLAVGSAISADLARPLTDAARTREPVVIENHAEREKLYPGLGHMGAIAEVALIAVPLIANGRACGGFVLAFEGTRVFGDDERAYLATLGRIGGQALVRIT